tara:strand:- start:2378 stop:2995 length:618 start_codon:yes stop_codon:yes gene_type:complete
MSYSIVWESDDLKNLNEKITETGGALQGCCMYQNGTRTFSVRKNIDDLRQNLFDCGKRSKKILEVGFNAGHSNLIFLFGNPDAEILNFDLMGHKYSYPCLDYLKSKYNVSVIAGNSMKTLLLKEGEIFNLIHIDGGHGDKPAFHDLVNCKRFADKATLMIFDDTNSETITKILEFAIHCKFIKEINYEKEKLKEIKHHRIFRYVI